MEKDIIKTISIYQIGSIMSSDCVYNMVCELMSKMERDKKILNQYNTKENQLCYEKNEYALDWLKADYYNIRSLSSKIEEEDVENGWFIWLKDRQIIPGQQFDTLDEEYAYVCRKYFDYIFRPLFGQNGYLDEAIWCFREEKYRACVCLLFTVIEYLERQISEFNPSEKFVMSKELKQSQTTNVSCFNEKYYQEFENKMNTFLRTNYYAKSTANDPEPKVINRNRVMHGILTRNVSEEDCLKLLILTKSMYLFNEWLECYRQMDKISKRIKELENEINNEIQKLKAL